MAYKKTIYLKQEDASEFSMVAGGCDFDVVLSATRFRCNAKRVEEMRMIDFTKALTLEYDGYDKVFEQ